MQKEDGLICREPQPRRRPQHHGLPAAGWPRRYREGGAPAHVEDVPRNFIDLLTRAELDMLAALNERVLRHLAKDDDSPAEDKPS